MNAVLVSNNPGLLLSNLYKFKDTFFTSQSYAIIYFTIIVVCRFAIMKPKQLHNYKIIVIFKDT